MPPTSGAADDVPPPPSHFPFGCSAAAAIAERSGRPRPVLLKYLASGRAAVERYL
jgi:hypothetical protein